MTSRGIILHPREEEMRGRISEEERRGKGQESDGREERGGTIRVYNQVCVMSCAV
jgi:hypothetical protein